MCDRVAVMYAGKVVEIGDVLQIFDSAAHPYSRALVESVPSVDRDVTVLPTIPGSPPSPDLVLPGCRFAPRCVSAFDRCSADPPEFAVGPGHAARCWLHAPDVA
jgi:oligopeptide/dipeptide ABC transporter ATP-binding protein